MIQLPDWFEPALKIIEAFGSLLGLVLAGVIWIARHTLVTKEDLQAQLAAHAEEHDALEKRLIASESRFVAVDSTIREVGEAAKRAMEAADKAAVAADKVHGVELSIAELRGEISTLEATLEPVKRWTGLMLEGHLNLGGDK